MSIVLVYLLNVSILSGFIWCLRQQRWVEQLNPYFYPALLLKFICGITIGILYFNYYGEGDTITYHVAAKDLIAYAKVKPIAYLRLLFFNEFESESFRATIRFSKHPGFSNSFYLIKIVSVLNLLTNGAYYLNTLYVSLFSFWGAARLTAALSSIFPAYTRSAVLSFLFFPSVVFWSSGLLKDSLMLGSMCWVIAFALRVAHRKKVNLISILLFFVMLYVYIRIKIFFSAPLIAILLSYTLIMIGVSKFEVLKKLKVQILLMFCFLIMAGISLTQFIPIFNLDFVFTQIITAYTSLLEMSLHVPHMEYPQLEATWQSISLNAPSALLNALYRPFLGESSQLLHIVAGIESLVLVALSIISLVSFFRKGISGGALFHVAIGLFILISAVIIGLTTPNFGSLSRYRIMFLPFLIYLLLQNMYMQRFVHKLRLP